MSVKNLASSKGFLVIPYWTNRIAGRNVTQAGRYRPEEGHLVPRSSSHIFPTCIVDPAKVISKEICFSHSLDHHGDNVTSALLSRALTLTFYLIYILPRLKGSEHLTTQPTHRRDSPKRTPETSPLSHSSKHHLPAQTPTQANPPANSTAGIKTQDSSSWPPTSLHALPYRPRGCGRQSPHPKNTNSSPSPQQMLNRFPRTPTQRVKEKKCMKLDQATWHHASHPHLYPPPQCKMLPYLTQHTHKILIFHTPHSTIFPMPLPNSPQRAPRKDSASHQSNSLQADHDGKPENATVRRQISANQAPFPFLLYSLPFRYSPSNT